MQFEVWGLKISHVKKINCETGKFVKILFWQLNIICSGSKMIVLLARKTEEKSRFIVIV